MPSAAPSIVGIVTDHPTSPIIPRPNQTPCAALRLALNLRSAFAPTSSPSVGTGFEELRCGASVIVKRRHAADESALQLGQGRAFALLVFVEGQKVPFDRR